MKSLVPAPVNSVTYEDSIEPGLLVSQARVLQRLLRVEAGKSGQEVELEVVAQPVDPPGLEPARVVVLAHCEGLPEVEPDPGVPVTEEDLVAAYLVDAAVEG